MNRENIIKVRDVIAATPPERLDMTTYFCRVIDASTIVPGSAEAVQESMTACGTAACIAGWAIHTFKASPLVDGEYCPEVVAAEILGLTTDDADSLFCMRNTDRGLWEAGHAHAVAVLDHLIDDNEVDWDAAFAKVEAAKATGGGE